MSLAQGTNRRLQIPRLYTLLRWLFLIVIAISTALVGFFQSLLVSSLYKTRTEFLDKRILVRMHYEIAKYQLGTILAPGALLPSINSCRRTVFSALQLKDERILIKFLEYTGFNLLLAWLCCFVMWVISPAASGSGIPDVKAYLNGVESPIFKNFFTVKTFIAKVCITGTHFTADGGVVQCLWPAGAKLQHPIMANHFPLLLKPFSAPTGLIQCSGCVIQPRYGQGGPHASRRLHFGGGAGKKVSTLPVAPAYKRTCTGLSTHTAIQ